MKRMILTVVILGNSLLAGASQSIIDNVALSEINKGSRVTNIESKNKAIMADYSQYLALTRLHMKSDQRILDQQVAQYQKKK